MEQKYIYRVLNEEERISNMVLSKDYFDYAPWIDVPKFQNRFGPDALDTVASHITKGHLSRTPWISCSKDIDILRHFATSQEDIRPSVALIKNHSKTILDSQNFIELCQLYDKKQINYEQFKIRVRNLYFYQIKKAVLDFSCDRDKLFQLFIKLGMVHKKDGEIRWKEFTRETNYARSNSEVIILGSVPNEEAFILTPLQYDILYTLIKNGSITELNDDIVNFIYRDLEVYHKIAILNPKPTDMLTGYMKDLFISLDSNEQFIFNKLYIERIPIPTLCKNDKNLIKIVLTLQKQILEKIICLMNEKRSTNFNKSYIKTLEEDKIIR